jgi:hypothetical protein
MSRQIRLTFATEGVSAIADLLEDVAPETCAAVWNALPAANESHHAIYSGSECVLVLPETLRLAAENATSDVTTGDVGFTWFAAGSARGVERDFAEVCWFYDQDSRPSMAEGPVPVNIFARIREGGDAFYAVCRRMRREGVKPLVIERVAADAGLSAERPWPQIALLADRFAHWQASYGRPDPQRCPFVTPGPCISTQFHSPTFMAMALYSAYHATGKQRYKEAADRYITFYFACMRNPPAGGQRQDYPSYPYQYGMALAGYRRFRDQNPNETSLDGKAAAIFEWLLTFRWNEGSYFRNSYGNPKLGVYDCGFSDDNLHMGRGLMGYYAVSKRPEVLQEAEGLARYYVTEAVPGTYVGCWSSDLGTWIVGPTAIDSFEHFRGKKSYEIGWAFSSVGAIEFLTQVAAATQNSELKAEIAPRCVRSMQWQFDACQFEDGACGMRARDDKYLGTTAGAILSYLRTREAGYLSATDAARYGPKARAARDWLRTYITPESVDTGGYFPVTGEAEPRPPENLAWLLAWTLEALLQFDAI